MNKVTQTIKITIQDQTFELTREEAKEILNGLKEILEGRSQTLREDAIAKLIEAERNRPHRPVQPIYPTFPPYPPSSPLGWPPKIQYTRDSCFIVQ